MQQDIKEHVVMHFEMHVQEHAGERAEHHDGQQVGQQVEQDIEHDPTFAPTSIARPNRVERRRRPKRGLGTMTKPAGLDRTDRALPAATRTRRMDTARTPRQATGRRTWRATA